MLKNGDKSVMHCSKCQVETPHTYKVSTVGDFSRKLLGKTFQDIGSGWYCDNCGKKNVPQMDDEEWEEDLY